MGMSEDETLWVLEGGANRVWELQGEDGRHLEGIVQEWMKGASFEEEEPLR